LRIAFAVRAHNTARSPRATAQRALGLTQRASPGEDSGQQLTPAEIAWILVPPCGILTVVAMVLLGGPLGSLLLTPHGQSTMLPEYDGDIFLKPAQQARYLIALGGPLLLAVTTALLASRARWPRPRATDMLVIASQCLGAVFIVVCLWIQRTMPFPTLSGLTPLVEPFFSVRTLLSACAIAALVVLAIRHEPLRRRATSVLRDRRLRLAIMGATIAVLATAIWILAGVNFDDTIRNASYANYFNVKGPLDETFAVLDGRTPLVNFTATYGSLWPYVNALVMSLLGTTFGVFSITMCTITALSLLVIFAVLRRVTPNALAALLLYLPFLANGFFEPAPYLANRAGPITVYALFPLRYAGPYLLVWLTARHFDGARPRQRWLLFLAAGLVMLNNTDFGIPAFGATLAAALWSELPAQRTTLVRLLRDTFAGLLSAYALVSVVTLLRTGSPVKLSVLLFYPHLYGITGYGLLPTQALGLAIVVYLTYVAAIAVATVRVIHRDRGRLLTALLVWSGVFGLGLGGYYMGRTSPSQLISMFSAWTFCMALLTIVAVTQLSRDRGRRLAPAHIAIFLGMGVAACSLAQTPLPWTQLARLQKTAEPTYVTSPALKQILVHYGEGKPEAIMSVIGHRQAYEAGVVNVSPYLGTLLTVTYVQLDNTLHALRAAGGHLLVLPVANTYPYFYRAVCQAGFSYIKGVEVGFEYENNKPRGLTLWSAPVPGATPHPCPTT
jgi:hypothetical protein